MSQIAIINRLVCLQMGWTLLAFYSIYIMMIVFWMLSLLSPEPAKTNIFLEAVIKYNIAGNVRMGSASLEAREIH